MRALKICIVANSTWNIYNFRQELIRHLMEAGHQVVVIAPVDEYIHYLNGTFFTKHIPLRHLDPQGRNLFRDARLLFEFYRIYRRERPDLILHYTIKPNIYGSLAAGWLGIRNIATLTGLGQAFMKENVFRMFVISLYRKALKSCAQVVFHNEDDMDTALRLRFVKEGQAIVIPGSGVDPEVFKPMPRSRNDSQFVFLFIGRLLIDKGIREFVEAAIQVRAVVKNASFWIVGEFDESNPNSVGREELLYWVSSRFVKYFGKDKDVRRYIADADVVVLPSYREGMPRTLLEAMAMEKPVIATDVPGCRAAVKQEQNGFLVPPKDAQALSKAMLRMYYLSAGEHEAMGRAGRSGVLKHFQVRDIVQAYERLLIIEPVDSGKRHENA
ncbi:MAG TPA: glycosyltransferase family 4 protein [Saprospiraceae bacterium]|nr:glycosyltransferase family 4 protein [Saprospiraceae bacterium]